MYLFIYLFFFLICFANTFVIQDTWSLQLNLSLTKETFFFWSLLPFSLPLFILYTFFPSILPVSLLSFVPSLSIFLLSNLIHFSFSCPLYFLFHSCHSETLTICSVKELSIYSVPKLCIYPWFSFLPSFIHPRTHTQHCKCFCKVQ